MEREQVDAASSSATAAATRDRRIKRRDEGCMMI
jgi:hypothetical protein